MHKLPITQRAKCSPLKLNESLVANAASTAKGFTDLGEKYDRTDLPEVSEEEKEKKEDKDE